MIRKQSNLLYLALAAVLVVLFLSQIPGAAAPVTPTAAISLSSPYSQNFDTLAVSGTGNIWTDDSTISGWYATRTLYNAGTGSSNTGALYSFGTGTATERALGSVASGGTGTMYYGGRFVNDTGAAVTSLTVTYTGEQWRDGGNATPVAQQIEFSYQISTTVTSLTTGTWTDVDLLDFVSPTFTATAGALDGNAAANRTTLSQTFAVNIPAGFEIMIRWQDINNAGNDHGLAVDDLTVSTGGAPTDTAPSVASTTPTNGATNIALNSDVTVTFSEDVTLDASWYAISCSLSGTHTGVVTGGPLAWTVNPTTDFVAGETCTVTIDDLSVHDTDTDDPPDVMAADYVFSFSTISVVFGTCGDNNESLIHDVQGNGLTSPIVGSTPVLEGVVTADYQNTPVQYGGFFVQEENADVDADPATSEGIYVFDSTNAVNVGDVVRLQGTVTEFISGSEPVTEITAVTGLVVCSSGSALPTATAITLPIASIDTWEQYEGMLVQLPQTLSVTEVFTLGRFGEVLLSQGGVVYQYTHLNTPSIPGNAAYQNQVALRTIILDDANAQQNKDPIVHPAPGLTALNTLRISDTISSLVGILDHRFDEYRIQPVGSVTFTPANPRTAAPAPVGGTLKVASFNVLNYFSTIDTGSPICGPLANQECRGADSALELTRQRDKLVQAILALDADVVGLIEIENHATDAALDDLIAALNAVAGPGTYAKISAFPLGSDAIKGAIIYQPASVMPVGAAMTDAAAIFDRPPLAQTFQSLAGGEQFTLVINHFKSKSCSGATGPDADTGDGQGCYNDRRTQQATQLLSFINTVVIPTSGDSDVLVMGDLNAYALEQPITTLTSASMTDLINTYEGNAAYSYVFDGQVGYLDHALANASLATQVTGVTHWHNNADEPIVLDYNVEFKSAGQVTSLYNVDPYRTSDHNPVVVGLFEAATPTPTPTSTATPTSTPTSTPTATPTSTPTNTPTSTATGTATSTPTSTPTMEPTFTPTSEPPTSVELSTVNGQRGTGTTILIGLTLLLVLGGILVSRRPRPQA